MTQAHDQPSAEARGISASLRELGRVHFLGMAGVGVSAVARLMHAAGVPVSGTDAKDLPVLEEFRQGGVPVRVGYAAQNISSVEEEAGERISTIVASSVAAAGNPEYDEAVRRGCRILHRSEGLARVMEGFRTIAVAGTHGKTTTSSMAAVLLNAAGAQPGFAVGANVAGMGVNAELGSGEWFVAEADESDGSLLNYSPEVAILTNIEADHLDHYGTAEAVDDVFARFALLLPERRGVLVACADDEGVRRLLNGCGARLRERGIDIVTYGFAEDASLRILEHHDHASGGFGQDFTVGDTRAQRTAHAQVTLSVPGRHNALNATAAIAAAGCAGVPLPEAAAAVRTFRGAARRFELRGDVGGIRVYDDYAHHPTEVAAVLAAARSAVGGHDSGGSVHAVFQPHLYSRTQAFGAEFGEALQAADTVAVLDVYPAREEPIPGVSAQLLGQPVMDPEQAVSALAAAAAPGDIILTLGAGDVTALGHPIVAELQRRLGRVGMGEAGPGQGEPRQAGRSL